MKIGVFDSGVGGLSVAQAIERALPQHEILFRHDSPEHFPYATKAPEEIFGYVVPVVQSLVDDGCAIIVVACNTVSTTLIDQLRDHFNVPLIPVEPHLKSAEDFTVSNIIAVCATPTTLASQRYAALKHCYTSNMTVLEPDCADWSTLIEHNEMNEERLHKSIDPILRAGADVIILGCTHYHWIEADIVKISKGRAVVIQPEEYIIRQVKREIARLA